MTWETMQPRERDAEILRLLGWRESEYLPGHFLWEHDGGLIDTMPSIPYYTTDPAAALGLLEEMRKRGLMITQDLQGAFVNDYYQPDDDFCYPYGVAISPRHGPNSKMIYRATFEQAATECVYRALGGDDA